MTISSILAKSPIESVYVHGHQVFIKRDDLLNHHFSGNKARKLAYFLDNDFPGITRLMGYGSVQANSLYSLAALAHLKGWQLDFYVNRIPIWLKDNPLGNYRGAMALGANIVEVGSKLAGFDGNLDDYMHQKSEKLPKSTLFVPEGGRSDLARHGIKYLADEIKEFCTKHIIDKPVIMLPSGTGTTALFLQYYLPYRVLTCACVGDDHYLKKQFKELSQDENDWPEILTAEKTYHFGKLYPEFYQLWRDLTDQTGIEFDLLYDPMGWMTLLNYLKQNKETNNIIYIHQGGLMGNESMIPRYQRTYG